MEDDKTEEVRPKRKRWLVRGCFIAIGVLAVVIVAGVFGMNWLMSQPLYRLGSVQAGDNLRGPLQPPAQTDEQRWQVEEDISLAFQSYGDGDPILVVHGGPGIPYAKPWKGLEPLTDQHTIYYYHQRGSGDSTRPFDRFEGGNYYENMVTLERTLGLGAQIADIERIRRILGVERLTIVGHSFGGFLATLYATEFPDRVSKLILVSPAGVLTPPDADRNLFELVRAELPDEQRAEFDVAMNDYFDFGNIFSKSDAELADLQVRTGSFILPAMGYDPVDDRSSPRSGGWSVFAMYFSVGRAQDYRPALTRITAPTLILQGEDDTIALAGARTYQPIAGAQFVTLSRENEQHHAGHFLFDDCPQGFEQNMRQFLAK